MKKLIKLDSSLTTQKDKNPAAVYLTGLAPTGRRAMAGRLKTVAEMLGIDDPLQVPWHQLRFQHVAAIKAKLQETKKLAPATVNAVLYAIRGVARAAFNLELMTADDYQRIRDVRPVKGEKLPSGRGLSPGEISALMDDCVKDDSPAGFRDGAIIALMYAGGPRREEVATLDLEGYNAETGELKIKGKGNKERLIFVNNGAADALADWLGIRGDSPGPLFYPINRGGNIQPRRMVAQSIYDMLRKRAKNAGVKRFSPHDLRRSFVSDLLDKGADISIVQKLAGHSNIATTAKYDRRDDQAKKQAVGLLNVPYRRRGK